MNLGHPLPLLITDDVQPLRVRAVPTLGSIEWPIEEPQVIALRPGWQLFFYTDGLIEGRSTPGSPERYGVNRLMDRLRSLCGARFDADCMERLVSTIEAEAAHPSMTMSP